MDALNLAYNAIRDGAVGVDMGRNIWQSEYPVPMAKAVRTIWYTTITLRMKLIKSLEMRKHQPR